MEEQRTTIRTVSCVFRETREHTVDHEMILPDYYPEIERVVNCVARPVTEIVTVSTDKLSVAGCVQISLTYTGPDKDPVVFEQQVRYTKVIPCSGTADGDIAEAEQYAVNVRYQAAGPRRFSVHLTLAIGCSVLRISEESFLSDCADPRVAARCGKRQLLEPSSLNTVNCEFRNAVTLPVQRDLVSCFICQTARVRLQEVSAVANKIMINGSVSVGFSVIAKDGVVYRMLKYHFPFTEICDAYGVKEGDEIFARPSDCVLQIESGGSTEDDRTVSTVVSCRILFYTGKTAETCYVEDAFVLHGDTNAEFVTLPLPEKPVPVIRTDTAAYELALREPGAEPVGAVLENLRISMGEKGALRYAGELQCFYLDADKKLHCLDKKIETETESVPLQAQRYLFLRAEAGDVTADVSDSTLRASCEIRTEGFTIPYVSQSVLKAIHTDEIPESAERKLILYYADPGESVWEIAKKYKTSPVQLAAGDDEGLSLKEKKLLAFYA